MGANVRDKGQALLALHRAERGFVLPNAWDRGSAVILASEGFAALGTTSAGIAFSLGKPDYQVQDAGLAVTRDEMLDAVRAIVDAVPVPVTADLEAGYGSTPEAVAETIRLAIACGAAGGNIEDADAGGGLFDEGLAVARVAAARDAIRASGRTFVLNARTDALGLGGAEGFKQAIRRANAFFEAGADCVFTPGIADAARASLLVRELAGPLNLVVGLNEAGSSAFALIDAGVKRVSVGGSIARSVLGLVRRCARELRDAGTVGYAAQQIPQAELNALFARASNSGSLPYRA
ncbi:MAG TPA: isocitrate lyase/phosphoenolpyruvate mutase family protein [Burkholderiaceae bacterium]|nr:isocitrate lyase/phosphoenolpyruvate mutase family protein [Burkholderiaceae bacterium]